MWKFLIVLCFIVAAQSCRVDVNKDGAVTARNAHPSHVLIETFLTYKIKRMCSGVLISIYFALTTAECVIDAKFVNVHIYPHLLRQLYETDREIYRATTVIIRPGYNATNKFNDVALVRLPHTLNATSTTYSVAKYPPYFDQLLPEQKGISVGWGLLNYNDEQAVNYRQEQTMQVTTDTVCRESYPGMWTDESDYQGRMCVRSLSGGNNCDSDNGSPMYMDDVIVGLQSFGQMEACLNGAPNGIQEVRFHLTWVEAEIGLITP